MAIILLAVLATLGASSARAEQSARSQQVTDARLALVSDLLPAALALPEDVALTADQQRLRAQDQECPLAYKVYRGQLADFAHKIVTPPMHSLDDVAAARAEFDSAFACASKIAHEADPEFGQMMEMNLALAKTEVARQGAARIVNNLENDRVGPAQAGKTLSFAAGVVRKLEQTSRVSDVDALMAQVKPDAGAMRFAQDWIKNHPVYAAEFRPPLPPQYRRLDGGAPPAAPAAAAPVQPSALASFISQVSAVSTKYAQRFESYAQKVSNAIVTSSAARDIDARLSAAVVWAESNFHAAARSFANCVGLGQLSQSVADAYRVKDRTDVNQNLKGTTGYLRQQIDLFASKDDQDSLRQLMAQNAADVRQAVARGEPKQRAIDDAFNRMWPQIPTGMKNAVAAYNAGPYALAVIDPKTNKVVRLKKNWDQLIRPGSCKNRPRNDSSYCQTLAYVPRVLKDYLTVSVETSGQGPEMLDASAKDPAEELQTVTVQAQYRRLGGDQTGL